MAAPTNTTQGCCIAEEGPAHHGNAGRTMASWRILRLSLFGALLNAGCATEYVPRHNGRIHFVMSGKGDSLLEKNGKTFPVRDMGYSEEVVDAFADNPAAEAHARIYVNRERTAATMAIIAGITIVLGGLTVAFNAAEPTRGLPPEDSAGRRTGMMWTGLSSMGVGALLGFGAAIVAGSAPPHLLDAVNIYNAQVSTRYMP